MRSLTPEPPLNDNPRALKRLVREYGRKCGIYVCESVSRPKNRGYARSLKRSPELLLRLWLSKKALKSINFRASLTVVRSGVRCLLLAPRAEFEPATWWSTATHSTVQLPGIALDDAFILVVVARKIKCFLRAKGLPDRLPALRIRSLHRRQHRRYQLRLGLAHGCRTRAAHRIAVGPVYSRRCIRCPARHIPRVRAGAPGKHRGHKQGAGGGKSAGMYH